MAKVGRLILGGFACVMLLRICGGSDEKVLKAAAAAPSPIAAPTPKAEVDMIIAKAELDFAAGFYDAAREALYNLKKKLDAEGSPRAEEVNKLTLRAACANGMSDTSAYVSKEWAKHRQEMNQKAAEYDLTGIRVRSAVARLQIQCIRIAPEVAAKVVPAKYRTEVYLKSLEADIAKIEAKDAKIDAYLKSCGAKPDGSYEAEHLVKRTANDPDSIDVDNCTDPVLLKQGCWMYRCEVRGKNAFGALILNHMTFRQDATTIRSRS